MHFSIPSNAVQKKRNRVRARHLGLHLKGQEREMAFWLNPTHLVEKERIYNIFHGVPL
jgi:hypothetical protein